MRRSLTKSEIIRKKADIDRIFHEGESVVSGKMRLLFLKNGLGYDRFIPIPARKFGTAVERNLTRRRAKEVFRNHPGRRMFGSNDPDSMDIALVIYPGKVSSFVQLESEFLKLSDGRIWK